MIGECGFFLENYINNYMKKNDEDLIWEAYDAPGGRPVNPGMGSDGNIPPEHVPVGGGELEQLTQRAIEITTQLPEEKRDGDFEEVLYNVIHALNTYIEEIDIKINN
jgi:hypothetical protein